MKVAIIGYGIEGKSAAAYWQAKGAEITVCDQDTSVNIPAGIPAQLGNGYLKNLSHFDVINRTGSIHPNMILAANAGVEGKITSVINEFFKVSPTNHIIGVTGTKGKGTTSTLITKILQAAGKKVFLAGNIGSSPLNCLNQLTPDSWVVLELSSYQLYDLKKSPHIAVCLMVVPEHLNWHGDMDDYVRSKQQLFAHQNAHDIAIYFADNELSHTIASASSGAKIPYFANPGAYVQDNFIVIDNHQLCKTDELQLIGKHNWQNVCAAVTAVWQITQDIQAIRTTITAFTGLPHRLEFVRELRGIRYYNDSFAAGLHATEAAIEAIDGHKVMIVGGFDRFLPLEHFAVFLNGRKDVRGIVLIGQTARKLAAEFDQKGINYHISSAEDMGELVDEATDLAKKGDAVVLSPGFASFDMFKNFGERGELFRKAVHKL